MKLTPGQDLVKPDRLVLAVAAVTVLVTALVVQLVVSATSREQQRMDRFGDAAARALAELAVEPIMQQDRMHLAVIGNRLAETPEIQGVATHTPDDRVLTSTGELRGPQYTQPVTIDDSIVGYVRITLVPQAFAAGAGTRLAALVVALLAVPFAVASGWTLARAIRDGRLHDWLPRRPSRRTAVHEPPVSNDAAAEDAEPAGNIRHYLLALNLYNQLTLQPDQRDFELSLCTELAEAVAEIYQGQVVSLPGVGVVVDFDHTDDPDRPFQVLCAAFVLARLLRDEAPFGHYRLGLNVAERPADETLPLNDEAIADASLLSALARDMSLAVSATFSATLSDPDRWHGHPLVNPLLDELVTSPPSCLLVTSLAAPYAGLVAQQAQQLERQRATTSSPSTF